MDLHQVLIQQSTQTYAQHLVLDQSQPMLTWSRASDALKMVLASYAGLLLAGNEPFINISWGLLLRENGLATFEVQSRAADCKCEAADVERLW